MATTKPGLGGYGVTDAGTIADKTVAASATLATLVEEFDTWREDYAGAIVEILIAGTTTRATVYSDFNLSTVAANPQTLLTDTDASGRTYGKFQVSLYVNQPYYLKINGQEETGVQRAPFSTLRDVDASEALVTTFGGTIARYLRQRFADAINVRDYGMLRATSDVDASATENAITIQAAIGVASAAGGGRVLLPSGTFAITTLSLPSGVILVGQGRSATVLQSDEADKIVTVTGDDAGLAGLTIDGIDLTASSYGIYGKDVDRFSQVNVTVKRFDKGIEWKGGEAHRYLDLIVNDHNYGFRGLGDADAGNGDDGDEFDRMTWEGGEVSETGTTGFEISVVDLQARYNIVRGVHFRDNAGDQAALIYGAEGTEFHDCKWTGSTLLDLDVKDNPDTTLASRQVQGLYVEGCRFEGDLAFDGLCERVEFERCEFIGSDLQFNTPTNEIRFTDCRESSVTTDGDTTKKGAWSTTDSVRVTTTTTSTTPVTVWKHQLQPGETILVHVRAAAQRTDGEAAQILEVASGARCDSADINYDGQTANFTVGETATGASSGATGIIVADSDAGTSGTLSLVQISGTFIDNEIVTDSATGSARVNGSMTFNAAALLGTAGGTTMVTLNSGSPGYLVQFGVSSREIQVYAVGASSQVTSWVLDIITTSVGDVEAGF